MVIGNAGELREFRDGIFADHRSWRSWLNIPAPTGLVASDQSVKTFQKLHISNTTNVVTYFKSTLLAHIDLIRISYKLHTANMFKLFLLLGLWTLTATAQFGFFDQMFGNGGGQQQQQQANVRSDSSWYQAQYENGKNNFSSPNTRSCRPESTFKVQCFNWDDSR